MSQRDVLAELRTARVEAPAGLRARVRLIAADAPQPRRSRRRFALLLVPVVGAAIAAGVFFSTRPQHRAERQIVQHGAAVQSDSIRAAGVAPSAKRLQQYSASLGLEAANVEKTVTQAIRVATSLSGYPSSVHIHTSKSSGTADVLLRVPRKHVQAAVARIARLGKVTSEQVDIQDLQAGVNETDRTIARLERELETAPKDVAARLTARIRALQRARAATIRIAHFATVQLSVSTPPVQARTHHHYGRDALPWLGGAAAALLLLLAVRGLAATREARLLSRF